MADTGVVAREGAQNSEDKQAETGSDGIDSRGVGYPGTTVRQVD